MKKNLSLFLSSVCALSFLCTASKGEINYHPVNYLVLKPSPYDLSQGRAYLGIEYARKLVDTLSALERNHARQEINSIRSFQDAFGEKARIDEKGSIYTVGQGNQVTVNASSIPAYAWNNVDAIFNGFSPTMSTGIGSALSIQDFENYLDRKSIRYEGMKTANAVICTGIRKDQFENLPFKNMPDVWVSLKRSAQFPPLVRADLDRREITLDSLDKALKGKE